MRTSYTTLLLHMIMCICEHWALTHGTPPWTYRGRAIETRWRPARVPPPGTVQVVAHGAAAGTLHYSPVKVSVEGAGGVSPMSAGHAGAGAERCRWLGVCGRVVERARHASAGVCIQDERVRLRTRCERDWRTGGRGVSVGRARRYLLRRRRRLRGARTHTRARRTRSRGIARGLIESRYISARRASLHFPRAMTSYFAFQSYIYNSFLGAYPLFRFLSIHFSVYFEMK